MGDIGIIVTGASGRMGSRILQVVHKTLGLKLLGACDAPGASCIGEDAGLSSGFEELGVLIEGDLARAIDAAREASKKPGVATAYTGAGLPSGDVVVVDFTCPAASVSNAEVCGSKGAALVVGTTGLAPSDEEAIEKASEQVPIVKAPNMSVGVNLMLGLARRAARALGDEYDVEILETHHRMKADAPSGTALRLGEVVAEARGSTLEETGVYERKGIIGKRSDREIGVQTLRGGDVVGEHTVYFLGKGDRMELTHRATSRDVFVHGAVRAARWVFGRSPGLYGMEDVLELR